MPPCDGDHIWVRTPGKWGGLLYICTFEFVFLCICVFLYEICTVQTMMVTMGAWDWFGHGANVGLGYICIFEWNMKILV